MSATEGSHARTEPRLDATNAPPRALSGEPGSAAGQAAGEPVKIIPAPLAEQHPCASIAGVVRCDRERQCVGKAMAMMTDGEAASFGEAIEAPGKSLLGLLWSGAETEFPEVGDAWRRRLLVEACWRQLYTYWDPGKREFVEGGKVLKCPEAFVKKLVPRTAAKCRESAGEPTDQGSGADSMETVSCSFTRRMKRPGPSITDTISSVVRRRLPHAYLQREREEATNETLLKLWRKHWREGEFVDGEGKRVSNPHGLAAKIADTTSINKFREWERENKRIEQPTKNAETGQNSACDRTADQEDNPCDALMKREEEENRRRLVEALDKATAEGLLFLTDEERAVFHLRHFMKVKFEDIARQMGYWKRGKGSPGKEPDTNKSSRVFYRARDKVAEVIVRGGDPTVE